MATELIRVLVVDDDAGARALHGRYIAATPGFTVAGAVGTGSAAVQRVHAGGVDLILLDMRLPDFSGVEVLRRVRALSPVSPDVIIVSSARDQLTVRQALAAHIEGYLVKPFTAEALHDRLLRYQDAHRTRTSPLAEHQLAQGEIDRLFAAGQIGLNRGVPVNPSQTSVVPRNHSTPTGAQPPTPPEQLGARGWDRPEALPKGVSEVTLTKVLAALDPVTARSAVEVAQTCGISRATARRYLDYLVGAGLIDLAHLYGRRGRPEVLYRLAISQVRSDG